ncbi:sialic acid-binding Ig-like lectin 8 isoform X2 [Hyperolius riggenbachi]|uniref:sialic acid-binding Ig-like lectin 8 isoform X2 n=1 Tax=Hyperolius riggenbachi TaxID=752182 RepID=UPI0035A2A13E
MELNSGIRICLVMAVLCQLWRDCVCQSSRAGYSLQVDLIVMVQEGLCANIPCQFTANNRNKFTQSIGYWKMDIGTIAASSNRSIEGVKPNFHMTGDPDVGDCTLVITDARKQDSGTYFFRFEESRDSVNQYNYIANKITVQVTEFTQKPEINILKEMVANQEVTLTCSLPGSCPEVEPVVTWWKDTSDVVWEGPSMTLTPSLLDHQTSITCEVALPKVSSFSRRTVVLDVQYAPTITVNTVLESSGKALTGHTVTLQEGEAVTLRCAVDSNPPAHVTWTKGPDTVVSSMTGHWLELHLPHVKSSDSETYSCSAQNRHGDTSDFVDIEVQTKDGASDVSPGSDLERATVSPLHDSHDMDYKILIGLVVGNILILSLITLALFCFVRRNMQRRQQGGRV